MERGYNAELSPMVVCHRLEQRQGRIPQLLMGGGDEMNPGDPPVTVWLVSVIVACITAAGVVWTMVGSMIDKAAKPAREKSDANERDLAALRTHIAENYVSKVGLKEFRDEIMSGVRDIKDGMNHLNERIDGVIGAQAAKRTPRSPQ